LSKRRKISIIKTISKFIVLSILVGLLIGTATALFLVSLDYVTQFRLQHGWIIFSLPFIGILIVWLYNTYGKEVKKGNNLLIQEHRNVNGKNIPFIMAPLVLLTTLLTHLAGGSAGREGTAVQMGGAIADRFTKIFSLSKEQRNTLLIMGISAGFAAVFGTPITGAVFALEIMLFKNCKWADVLPSFAAAFIAHYTCLYWGIHHTSYIIPNAALINFQTILGAIIAGIIFGWAALLFSATNQLWKKLFEFFKQPYLVPCIGGIVIIIFVQLLGTQKYIGLGIDTIVQSFLTPVNKYDFIIKLLLTTFTLSAGFKGGEVTPLFFIGATLGNILIGFIPLPMALLAGMGFVAVFAGATHAAITGIVLGIELFGISAGLFVGIASIVAYFTSGINGIYSAQLKEGAKYKLYNFINRISKL
jgi:H+/Cl- antiporter ClcA